MIAGVKEWQRLGLVAGSGLMDKEDKTLGDIFALDDQVPPLMGPCDPTSPLMVPSNPTSPLMGPCDPTSPLIGPCDPTSPLIGPCDPTSPLIKTIVGRFTNC